MPGINHPRSVTQIKDVHHGTISITLIEREVIDSRQFQKMHHILQNSIVYASYPNNKVSRFVHSIGVCHLAGEMFTNSLSNSSYADLSKFLESSAELLYKNFMRPESWDSIENVNELLISGWESSICGRSGFTHHPKLRTNDGNYIYGNTEIVGNGKKDGEGKNGDSKKITFPSLFLIDTLWQVARLCGLLHDIGHLPMSHSFEGGVEGVADICSLYASNAEAKRYEKFRKTQGKNILVNDRVDFESFFKNYICHAIGISYKKRNLDKFLEKIPLHEARSLAICAQYASVEKEHYKIYEEIGKDEKESEEKMNHPGLIGG